MTEAQGPPAPPKEGTSAPRGSGWAARLPWARLGAVFACVTLGISQPTFNLIVANGVHHSLGPAALFCVFFWCQLLPFALVFSLDAVLARARGEGPAFRIWRTLMYGATFVSLLRQVQVHYLSAAASERWTSTVTRPAVLLALVAVLGLGGAALVRSPRAWRAVTLWFSYLGGLGAAFTALFFTQAGLLGAAWSRPTGDASRPEARSSRPNVYVLVFDELARDVLCPRGGFDEQEFPNFAALAKDGAFYPEAYSNDYWTSKNFPRLLTGRVAEDGGAGGLPRHVPRDYTLEFLGDPPGLLPEATPRDADVSRTRVRGLAYLTARSPLLVGELAWSYLIFTLVPDRIAGGVARTLDLTHFYQIGWRRQFEDLLRTADEAGPAGRFVFWHCMLPHAPFLLDDRGKVHGDLSSSWFIRKSLSANHVLESYRRQCRWVDRMLGEFLTRLKARGLYDSSIIMVTSDHGLRTFGMLEPEGYPEVLGSWSTRIPLIIRAPGLAPGVYAETYRHVDFLPTLLHLMKTPDAARPFDGSSLLTPDRPSDPPEFRGMHGERYRWDPPTGLWRRVAAESR